MKKLLVIAAVLALGSLAQASELWWTVSTPTSVDGSEVGWDHAYLMANSTGFNYGGTQVGSAVTIDQMDLLGRGQTDLSGLDSSAKYFYIELRDAQDQVVGKSYVSTQADGGKNQGAVKIEDVAGSIYDGPTSPGGASPYSGFTNFTTSDVIPEPTSGLLMALGMMMLALKRRRV